MTTFYLIRHATHDLVDRTLAGRMIDVELNAEGKRQAEALAHDLARERITRVVSSPRQRARQTAEPISAVLRLPLTVAAQLDEHDAGLWAGRGFGELAHDPQWRLWNERRGATRPPGGESMAELQKRIISYLDALAARYPDETIALVSHAEPIRAALMQARGIAFDDFLAIDVPVASVSRLQREPSSCTETELGAA